MKYSFTFLLTFTLLTAHSQSFTAGFISGTGFSDYQGNSINGKWQTKAGPLSGIFLRYAITPVLGFGSELNHITQEYYYKPYQNTQLYYNPVPLSSSLYILPGLYYYPNKQRWDYSFYRIPFYLTLTTPTKLQLSVSAGVFLSITGHHEYSGQTPGISPDFYNSFYSYSEYSKTPRYDNGLMVATSLSYPLSDDFRLYAMGRYFIGRKPFIDSNGGRTGASELAFGIAYTGLFRSKQEPVPAASEKDKGTSRLLITPMMGFNLSYFRGSGKQNSYSARTSLSPGLWLEYRLDETWSLLTGVSFERKGYKMNDSSLFFYRYAMAPWSKYKANTRVDLDYAVIPMLLKIRMGLKTKVYITGGPYIGIKLNARVTGSAETESFSDYGYTLTQVNVYDDIEGIIRNNDAGWIIGAGIDVPLAKGNMLDIGMHYAIGTRNVLKDDDAYNQPLTESDDVIRNASLNIHIGLTIPIHKSK